MAGWVRLLLHWVWGHVPAGLCPAPGGRPHPLHMAPATPVWLLTLPQDQQCVSLVSSASSLRNLHRSTQPPRLGWAHQGHFPFAPKRSIITGMVSGYRHRLSQDSRGGAHTELDSPRILLLQLLLRTDYRSIPGGPVVKNLPAKAGDVGSIPGKIPHMEEQPSLCTTTTEPVLWSLRATTAGAMTAEATKAEATTAEATTLEPRPLRPRPLKPQKLKAMTLKSRPLRPRPLRPQPLRLRPLRPRP